MKIFSLSSRRGLFNTALWLLVSGLLLIYVGTRLPHDVGGVDFAAVSSEIGTFILATVFVHWLFDMRAREELMSDITQFTIGNGHVGASGICDFVENTKNINYDEIIQSSEELVVALHYDPRFLSDYETLLTKRAASGNVTKIAILKETGDAMNFLKNIRKETDHIPANIKKIKSIIERVNSQAKAPIQLFFHDSILRYSFVMGGGRIWLKFYRNSRGNHSVCGIQMKKDTPMYRFISEDIENLLSEASPNV